MQQEWDLARKIKTFNFLEINLQKQGHFRVSKTYIGRRGNCFFFNSPDNFKQLSALIRGKRIEMISQKSTIVHYES